MKSLTLRKAVAIICAMLMLVSVFTGCGNTAAPTTSQTPAPSDSAAPSATPEEAKDPFETPLKFTFSGVSGEIAGMEKDGTKAANFEWFCDKFNVEFEFIPLTWGNYTDQQRMYMASGDGPDLMMMDISPKLYTEYLSWVEGGMLKEYANLDKFPNMKATMDKMVTGKKFFVDGKLYAWPAFMTNLDQYNYVGINGFYYRRDWAEKLGMAKPNDEYTWDEWIALVKAVLEKDPGGNGAGKTIGMMGKDYLFPKNFGAGSISPYLLDYTKDASGKWVWGPTLPESLEAVKLVKDLYDQGLIWKDQPMIKASDPKEKGEAGLLFSSAIDSLSPSSWKKTVDGWAAAHPEEDAQAVKAVAIVSGPDGKFLTRQKSDQWSQQAMNANMSDEKVERWMHMVDYMVSDEGINFIKYGIPGEDWETKDGQVVVKWTKANDGSVVKPYTYGSVWWQRAFVTADGIELTDPGYVGYFQDNINRMYKKFNSDAGRIIKLNPDLAYYTGPAFSKTGTKETEIYQAIAGMMVSKDIEKDWNAWVQSKMPEIQPVLDELNANLK
jgi:ABC-type glycerol-3-phosphate transport system substrate-binding protein